MAQTMPKKQLNKVPIITLILVCLSILATTSPNLSELFMLDREAIEAGEMWRLLVFPFVHFGLVHLSYNMIALCVTGWIVERQSRFHYAFLITLTAPILGGWLMATEPDMALYGGMSALIFSIMFYGALVGIECAGPWKQAYSLIVILLPAKVIWEFFQKASLLPYGEHQQFVVMPSSHAAGLAMGLIFYTLIRKTLCTSTKT